MVFRSYDRASPSGAFTYGPFPIRKGRLAGSFGALGIALLMAAMGADVDRLRCAPEASCVVSRTLGAEVGPFPAASLRQVRVDVETGSKNAKYGVVMLLLDGGREIRFARTSPTSAQETAATIRAGIDGKRPIDVEVRGPWWCFVFALALVALWIALARSALNGLGRFRLEVVRNGSALRAVRRVFGLPVASHEVSLEGVVDVRVEHGELDDKWRGRGEASTPAGRIVLVDRSGAARPLTERLHPGRAVHLRAAIALRSILGLAPRRGGVEEELSTLPLVTTKLGMRIAFCWLGVTCGLLLGLALYGVTGLALGLLRGRDGIDEWALAIGGGGGAILGILVVLYVTRPRPQR